MRKYLFTLLILLLFFGCFSACGGGSSDSEEAEELENRLSGNTYNAVGFEDITAFATDCEDGVLDEEDPNAGNIDIVLSFGPTVYTMNIEGKIAIGAWEAIDENTIEMIAGNDQVLEIDINIVETTIFFDLAEDWLTQNCSSQE